MGQAKQRGTLAHRKAVAIERAKADAEAEQAAHEERKRLKHEREMALPPLVRERRKEARFQTRMKVAMLVGMAAAMAANGGNK